MVQSEGRLYLVFEFVDKDLKKYFEACDGPLSASLIKVSSRSLSEIGLMSDTSNVSKFCYLSMTQSTTKCPYEYRLLMSSMHAVIRIPDDQRSRILPH